jgi:hypothetical protein
MPYAVPSCGVPAMIGRFYFPEILLRPSNTLTIGKRLRQLICKEMQKLM